MRGLYRYIIIFGSAVLIIFTGCSRNIERPPARESSKQKSSTQESSTQVSGQNQTSSQQDNTPAFQRKRTLTLNERDAGQADSTPAVETESVPEYQGRESLLYEQITDRIMPEDFIIGELFDFRGADAEMKSIAERVYPFLDALAENKIESGYLHPDWKTLIERSLADPGEGYSGFKSYRLGSFNAEETRARVNIRLLSEIGRSEGEVFLEKENGTWYISDIQIDLSKLLVKYEPEGEFEPSTYRWLEVY